MSANLSERLCSPFGSLHSNTEWSASHVEEEEEAEKKRKKEEGEDLLDML